MKAIKIILVISFFLLVRDVSAKILSKVPNFSEGSAVLKLSGSGMHSKKNPFTAYLESVDGVKFDLLATVKKKKKSQTASVTLPEITRPAIFTLKTSGGNISADETQDFIVFIGIKANVDAEPADITDYSFDDDYDTGFENFGLSLDGEVQVIKGDTGDAGEQGDTGVQGETGVQGAAGIAVFTGGTVAGVTTFDSLVTFTSSLNIPTNAADGKILTSDATGLASWQDGFTSCANVMNDLTDVVVDGDKLYMGTNAGSSDTTSANGNLALGVNSLAANTTGSYNTAVGKEALNDNISGNYNTGVGYTVLEKNLGSNNTGLGFEALATNTTGNDNTSFGAFSLPVNTLGDDNIAVGAFALNDNVIGSNNIAIGPFALEDATGSNNIAVGALAGSSQAITGNDNILIGYGAAVPSLSASNQLNIANSLYGDTSANKYFGVNENNPARNFHVNNTMRITARSSAPSSPGLGDIYVDSTSSELCFYDGSSWTGLKSAGSCS